MVSWPLSSSQKKRFITNVRRCTNQDIPRRITITICSKTLVTAILATLLAFSGLCTAIEQVPTMPHAFYGVVFVGEGLAPIGTSVEAHGSGVKVPLKGNPILTGSGGTFGGAGSYDNKLIVQGIVNEGTPIEFYINGARAEVFDVKANNNWTTSYPFQSTGITELNLRISTLPSTTMSMIATTATYSVSTAVTTYYSGSGVGGGSGGGIVNSIGVVTNSNTTIIPTITVDYSQNSPLKQNIPVTTVLTTVPATEIIKPGPTTAAPVQSKDFLPKDQLILYVAATLIFITVISLITIGNYEGWWVKKPPKEP